jgi:sentrin-specific protease 1
VGAKRKEATPDPAYPTKRRLTQEPPASASFPSPSHDDSNAAKPGMGVHAFAPPLGPPVAATPSLGVRMLQRPPLTEAEDATVDDALTEGEPSEVLTEIEGARVTRANMAALAPGEWLNDEVINVFIKVLANNDHDQGPSDLPSCYFMNTLFYPKLAESHSGYTYSNVRRWTRRADIMRKDMVLVPIHCHGDHWTLGVINARLRRFEYYDSLRGACGNVLTFLRRWLLDEATSNEETLDLTGWEEVSYATGNPQQVNGFDCGLFMLKTMQYLSQNARLDFAQHDMPLIRRRVVQEVLTLRIDSLVAQ